MLAVVRFQTAPADSVELAGRLGVVLDLLAARAGFRSGRVARAADDPTRWALVTEWDGAGGYRRAISAAEVKVALTPLLVWAVDEPTAYEVVQRAG